jgi:Mn2+/Fe2+ NRAMP family transporter
MSKDSYVVSNQTIKEPPASFGEKLKFLGPGFILSASIVGSGELIATTTLGAKAGFVAFWIIIVSCLVKVAVQLEYGKHAILTGETPMQAFNKLPGVRLGKGTWAVWLLFFLISLKIIQLGGMVGSTAIVLNMLFPIFPISAWVCITAIVSAALIFKGYYVLIEKGSLLMIAAFTVFTIAALFVLRYTDYNFGWGEVWRGLQFKFPPHVVAVAFGAFGITGVASDEIIAYNYWCLEKGYAAYTGPRTNDEPWKKRAKGWIKVMYLDATVAMIIYTSVTAAFYLLGAAVLHHKSVVPEGNQVIETLALMYTQTLGPGARTLYLVGAFFVLFSSVFASNAAWSRLFPDIFGRLGWINFEDQAVRKKVIAIFSWIIPVVWAMMFFFIHAPVLMILSGGIVGSIMLFLVVYAGIHFKKERHKILRSGLFYDIAFWLSVISILSVGVYGLVQIFA